MKDAVPTVLRTLDEITAFELLAAEELQKMCNHYFWTHTVTNEELELVLRILALKTPGCDLKVKELENWHVGYIRHNQKFGSGRRLFTGDVVLSNNEDENGDMLPEHRVWGPRLVHIGIVHEDDIDPM